MTSYCKGDKVEVTATVSTSYMNFLVKDTELSRFIHIEPLYKGTDKSLYRVKNSFAGMFIGWSYLVIGSFERGHYEELSQLIPEKSIKIAVVIPLKRGSCYNKPLKVLPEDMNFVS